MIVKINFHCSNCLVSRSLFPTLLKPLSKLGFIFLKGALRRKSNRAPIFFEFLTHFSILKLDWSMKRHRHAIALAGTVRA